MATTIHQFPSKPDLLTLDQAAAWLKIHPITLRKAAAEGSLPCRKIGREWRFSRQALLDFLGEPWSPQRTPPDLRLV